MEKLSNQYSQFHTTIGFGGPGAGKSNVLNYMIHGYASNHFKSSKSAQSGVTQTIQIAEGTALGIIDPRNNGFESNVEISYWALAQKNIYMFEEYSGLKIPIQNVIKFGNKKEHLLPLFDIDAQSSGQMRLVNNISQVAAQIKQELPSLVRKVTQRNIAEAAALQNELNKYHEEEEKLKKEAAATQIKISQVYRPVKYLTLIPFGAPGSGKSCILNLLCGIQGKFLSSKTARSGCTQNIDFIECQAFGSHPSINLKLYDGPGVGDFKICLDQIVLDIKLKIGHSQTFDGALIVIKSTDYRISVQETMAIKATVKFFSNFSPKHVFLIITHCDIESPTDDFIQEKLEMFKQYGPLEIPLENVVKFNNTAESLLPMLEKMENGNMQFVPDLEKKVIEISQEIEGDFKKQDKTLGTKNSEEFMMMIELLKDTSKASREQIAQMNQQLATLTGKMIELANRPPVVVESGGKFLSSKTARSGCTQKIDFIECQAFGNHPSINLKLYDGPGVGDFSLCLDQIVLDIKLKIGHSQAFDGALIVIKSTDYRISVQETMAIKATVKFFSNFSPKHVFLIITHCDIESPTDEFILEKLEMFKQYGPLDIPLENVVKFNNTAESLLPMLEKMENGNMQFVPDLEKKVIEISQELEGDFKRQDQQLGTKNGEEFMMMIELLKDSNQASREQIAQMNQQLSTLTGKMIELVNRPPVVVETGGGCSIF
ncbi:UNKNOWN [Stylonychia lemnae]|uniref:Uncharacterized protein n=1 Tax=Stylonychia lemnae TaxID=5949 RepID=A0A077ZRU7_STYLE|nr:UNKNOWN [Stylonychia lemnae]|eukprot:CDW72080.1 UNKNOWN [Stylonychia lemnae]